MMAAAAAVNVGAEVWDLAEEVGWAAVGTCLCWECHPPVASEPLKSRNFIVAFCTLFLETQEGTLHSREKVSAFWV